MDKKDLISLYESASPEFRAALEKEFGKFFFNRNVHDIKGAKKLLGLDDQYKLSIDKYYVEKVKAFYNLLILCDAWNKQDGFVPDFNNKKQEKWYPIFSLAGCGYSHSSAPSYAIASLGSRLCFKSRERADEFGKKFEGLFKMFLRG